MKVRTRLKFSLAFLLLCCLALSANAWDQEYVYRVKFAKGKSSAVMEDSIIRATRNIYVLGARKGQVMTAKVRSIENNAVIQIIDPKGKTPKGAGANGEDITYWKGKLPLNGDYRIAVMGTRGNASFTLEVSIY